MGAFRPGAVLLHSIAAAIMTYAWFELETLPNDSFISKQKGGHFQFLTIQGRVLFGSMSSELYLNPIFRLVIAWLTMVLSLLADIAPGIQCA